MATNTLFGKVSIAWSWERCEIKLLKVSQKIQRLALGCASAHQFICSCCLLSNLSETGKKYPDLASWCCRQILSDEIPIDTSPTSTAPELSHGNVQGDKTNILKGGSSILRGREGNLANVFFFFFSLWSFSEKQWKILVPTDRILSFLEFLTSFKVA